MNCQHFNVCESLVRFVICYKLPACLIFEAIKILFPTVSVTLVYIYSCKVVSFSDIRKNDAFMILHIHDHGIILT